ncbi:NADP-dependent oxidoreductase [Microbacterium sp.]|uniref:NADP-dependent oxidoreductase n=1 Tax=Microbacterium sp. TaxID=51671 RepID=UPI003C75EA05
MNAASTQVALVRRPANRLPEPSDFAIVSVNLPDLTPGAFLVRNEYLSIDPYIRSRLNEGVSAWSYSVGAAITGTAIGSVVQSRNESYPVGAVVRHPLGWRDLALIAPEGPEISSETAALNYSVEVIRPFLRVALSHYVGALGMPGTTAYRAIEMCELKPGETLFVSAAAGAVGSIVGQAARLLGAGRVIGSAGSDEKVELLENDLGFDAAFNYRRGDVLENLRARAPEGIDVYIDNVGNEQLHAAYECMNDFGRITAVGFISSYNGEPPHASNNFRYVHSKRLVIRGLMYSDHVAEAPRIERIIGDWIATGRLKARETIFEGVEAAPSALISTLTGCSVGKSLVRV